MLRDLMAMYGVDGFCKLASAWPPAFGTFLDFRWLIRRFSHGRPMHVAAAEEMPRVFDGLGNPIDGQPDPPPEDWPTSPSATREPYGPPISAAGRHPDRHLGDRWMNTLVLARSYRSSGNGLLYDQIAAQIVRWVAQRRPQRAVCHCLRGTGCEARCGGFLP